MLTAAFAQSAGVEAQVCIVRPATAPLEMFDARRLGAYLAERATETPGVAEGPQEA